MNYIRLCFSICFVILEIYGACDQPTFLQKYGIKRKPGSFRIVGGTPAEPGEFRGQVSLQSIFRLHICAGILIDPMHVLTAAHCHQEQKKIGLVMGDDVSVSYQGSETRQIRKVQHFVPHPKFTRKVFQHDIAVIRVDAPFKVTSTFGPMYRSKSTPVIGTECTVIGWGCTTNVTNSPISMELMKTTVNVIDINYCNSSVSYEGAMKPGMFCAGRMNEGGHDACQGDSGGLLTCGETKELTGIISFGDGCGTPEFPGVYTDVSMYKDWIDEVLSTEKLPDYIYSPFAQPYTDNASDNSKSSSSNTVNRSIILMTLFSVIISSFIC